MEFLNEATFVPCRLVLRTGQGTKEADIFMLLLSDVLAGEQLN